MAAIWHPRDKARRSARSIMWYEDLSLCDYFGPNDAGSLRAVGWLARGKPYPRGDVNEAVFEKLCELTQDPWSPVICCGIHPCDLCQFTGTSEATYQSAGRTATPAMGYRVSAGGSGVSLFVPGNGVIYASPTNITHYIDAHGYCPPPEFCDAVIHCPPMRSVEYMKAILANGGGGLRAVSKRG
jgi:hypothetical protein